MTVGTVLFGLGLGFGAPDTARNTHAARHFGARDIAWMHASYGLRATAVPLPVTALLTAGRSWRQVYAAVELLLACLAAVLALASRGWQDAAPSAGPGPAKPPAPPPRPRPSAC